MDFYRLVQRELHSFYGKFLLNDQLIKYPVFKVKIDTVGVAAYLCLASVLLLDGYSNLKTLELFI